MCLLAFSTRLGHEGFLFEVHHDLGSALAFPGVVGGEKFAFGSGGAVLDGGAEAFPKDADKDVASFNFQDIVDERLRPVEVKTWISIGFPTGEF